MRLDDKLINDFSDILDEATMAYYDALIEKEVERVTYVSALTDVIDIFLDIDSHHLGLLEEYEQLKVTNKLEELSKLSLNSEEVRKALLLLIIKGFKQVHFSLDLITPDAIGIIFADIISSCFDKDDKLTLLDPNFGSGNLAFLLDNYMQQETTIIGVENNNLLAMFSQSLANILDKDIQVYHQDALEMKPAVVDVIVSDLATYVYNDSRYDSLLYKEGVKYFPYLLIEKYLEFGDDETLYFFLIDNDFFTQEKNDLFKKMLFSKGHIKALVILPSSFFLGPAKSVLVLGKSSGQNTTHQASSNIFVLPPLSDSNNFIQVLESIKECLNEK